MLEVCLVHCAQVPIVIDEAWWGTSLPVCSLPRRRTPATRLCPRSRRSHRSLNFERIFDCVARKFVTGKNEDVLHDTILEGMHRHAKHLEVSVLSLHRLIHCESSE